MVACLVPYKLIRPVYIASRFAFNLELVNILASAHQSVKLLPLGTPA